jgi:hypothetical protein
MKNVCHNCPDRAVGCHGSCKRYLDAKAEHDRERFEKRDAYLKEKDIKELKFKAVARIKKITARTKHVSGFGVK